MRKAKAWNRHVLKGVCQILAPYVYEDFFPNVFAGQFEFKGRQPLTANSENKLTFLRRWRQIRRLRRLSGFH